ncbi:unnamed protein product [Rotaria sp. Silwood1]|nr:unnamed protein product [Rotaria sp. Silwood1]
MLIKYRSGVVYSTRHVRCISKFGKVIGRPIVHIRNSFTFKQTTSTWAPTIHVNQSNQTMNITSNKNVLILADYHPIFKNYDCAMPYYIEDPLGLLCTSHVSSSDRYEFLQNDISISTRFYRWFQVLLAHLYGFYVLP